MFLVSVIHGSIQKGTKIDYKGGIIHLDDVGGALAFNKVKNAKGELVDTLEFSSEDQIALGKPLGEIYKD